MTVSLSMKLLHRIYRPALLLSLALSPTFALACDSLASGQTFWIRLTSPVSTYSAKPGDPVAAVLTEAVECDNEVIFPVGTSISGVVRSVHKVGWGIRHETASLELSFNRATPAVGQPIAISASVAEIENAREKVTKGTIQGIRSSDTPQGRINSRLIHLPTWNPYSDVGLIVFKAAFPIFPEPEIYFPAGTDVRITLTEPLRAISPDVAAAPALSIEGNESLALESHVTSLPSRATTPALVDADLVNLAFVGSREQIEAAFREAGWKRSDAFNRHSFMRDFYAFLNNSGYAEAPMTPFLLNGAPADMSWEKSLNSYARRDHLRIWEWSGPSDSGTIWLSSSTHDMSSALSLKQRQFVHHIDPDIDGERSKVIRDLAAAGCVQGVHFVSRPAVPNFTENANSDPVRTDGALAIVELKQCEPVVPQLAAVADTTAFKPGNHVFRYFRRQILTFRSDIWRANIIYGAYDLGRMSVVAMKQHSVATTDREANRRREQAQKTARSHTSDPADCAELPDCFGFR